MLSKMAALVLPILFVTTAHAVVWNTTASWNEAAENEFSKFIANFPLDSFTNPSSPYFGIRTDCADAAYTLRTLFAAQHGLPVNYFTLDYDKTTKKKYELSNTISRFDSITDDAKRLRAFIQYVNDFTDTGSLPYDTYPVQINRRWVRPGTMFLHAPFEGSKELAKKQGVPFSYMEGHVYYLGKVQTNGLMTYIGSTVPAAVRNLSARQGILFAPADMRSGYRAWKWPATVDKNMPGYSEQQFSAAQFGWRAKGYENATLWTNWQENIQAQLRTREMTAEERYLASANNFKAALMERGTAVIEGWKFYKAHYPNGGCMDAHDYDNNSTPMRDKRIQLELQIFKAAAEKYVNSSEYRDDFSAYGFWAPERSMQPLERLLRNFKIQVLPNRPAINFTQIENTFMTQTVVEISEPEHSPEVRWGIASQGNWVCPDRAKQYKGGENVGREKNRQPSRPQANTEEEN